MTITSTPIQRRHVALVAAVAAASLGVALLLQRVLSSLVWLFVSMQQTDGLYDVRHLGNVFGDAFTTTLPLAVGVFLSFWLISPITAGLRMLQVILRSVLAIGIGVCLVFVVLAIGEVISAVSFSGPMFGASFPDPALATGNIPQALASGLASAITIFISVLPIGILAGVLVWNWLARHPAQQPASDTLDEV